MTKSASFSILFATGLLLVVPSPVSANDPSAGIGDWIEPDIADGDGTLIVAPVSAERLDENTLLVAYEVTNGGDRPARFRLSAGSSGGSRYPVIDSIHFDDGNGQYEPGIDVRRHLDSATPYLAANDGLTVFIAAHVPRDVEQGSIGSISMTGGAVSEPRATGGSSNTPIGRSGDPTAGRSITERGAGIALPNPLAPRRVPYPYDNPAAPDDTHRASTSVRASPAAVSTGNGGGAQSGTVTFRLFLDRPIGPASLRE